MNLNRSDSRASAVSRRRISPIKSIRRYTARPLIGELIGGKRFFPCLCAGLARGGAARAHLLNDPHSPPFYRVNCIVRNVDAWYTAFGMRPGDALYLAPANPIHIW